MAESENDLISRTIRFLNQQKEIYGDFSVSSKSDVATEAQSLEDVSATEAQKHEGESLDTESNSETSVEKNELATEKQNQESVSEKVDVATEAQMHDDILATKSQKHESEEKRAVTVTESTVEESKTDYSAEEATPELTEAELIAQCSTLEELRNLCEQSEALKTDLEGTNLVFGVGNPNADLMIIGEAPGFNEDEQGEPFVGEAGQLLDKIMGAIKFKRDDIYIANILKHRPPDNRDPKMEERAKSLPYLLKQIDLVDPKLILCVGRVSGTTLLNKDDSLKNMRSKFHEFHGRELMVTYHPAALLRNQNWKRPTWEDVQKLRERYDELGGQP